MLPRPWIAVGTTVCCLSSLSLVHSFTGRASAQFQHPQQSRQPRRKNAQPLPPTNANSFRRSLLLSEREDSSTSTIQQHEANKGDENDDDGSMDNKQAFFSSLFPSSPPLPPPEVEDFSVLLYDVLLLLNLTISVSFWVTHRYSFAYLGAALSEGCGLSVCWIVAGLLSGSFLYSAAHGHKGVITEDTTTTDVAVGALALNTFVNAVNLRLMFALVLAVVQHRPVGSGVGEDLLGLELGFGLVLMPVWRLLHGRYVTGRMM